MTASRPEWLQIDSNAAVWREVDGEVLVLELATAIYLTLNGSGWILWNELVDGAFAGKPELVETEFAKALVAGTYPGMIISAAQRQAAWLHKSALSVAGPTGVTGLYAVEASGRLIRPDDPLRARAEIS